MSLLRGSQFTISQSHYEMAARSSLSVIIRDQYFDFMAVEAENPVSYKYIVTEGSETVTGLSDKLG
jgi:hypothetical protein